MKTEKMIEPKEIVIIGGYGRSGSTLLEMLISKEVRLSSVGELKNLWSRGLIRGELCSCGTALNKCKFWESVMANISAINDLTYEDLESLRSRVERFRFFFFHRVLKIPSKTYLNNRRQYILVLKELYSAITKVSGNTIILDGSKRPAHIELLCEAFPGKVKVLHLVRDSRAVAYSLSKPKKRLEVHWKHELMQSNSAPIAALQWNFVNWGIRRLSSLARVQLVRYEELATNPKKVLNQILRELSQIEQSHGESCIHSVSGNPIRFERNSAIALDERWKSEMNLYGSILVTALTLPGLVRYRYIGAQKRSFKDPKE